jgi:hypothetical protein
MVSTPGAFMTWDEGEIFQGGYEFHFSPNELGFFLLQSVV